MAEQTTNVAVLVAVTLVFLIPIVLVAIPFAYEMWGRYFGIDKDKPSERHQGYQKLT